jgi:hypothetical protein
MLYPQKHTDVRPFVPSDLGLFSRASAEAKWKKGRQRVNQHLDR